MTAEQRRMVRLAIDAAVRAKIAERPEAYRQADEYDEAIERAGTTCKNGHPWTPETLLWSRDGKGRNSAYCRVCRRDSERARQNDQQHQRRVYSESPLEGEPTWTCRNGHLVSPSTAYTRPNGDRQCRICKNAAHRRYQNKPEVRERLRSRWRNRRDRRRAA